MEQGLILQPTYRIKSGVPVVQLWGRGMSGRPFLVEDDRFRPFFFVDRGAEEAIPETSGAVVEATALTGLNDQPVSRVTLKIPGEVPALRDRLRDQGFGVHQADVRFAYLYLMEHDLRAEIEIEGVDRNPHGAFAHFVNPTLRATLLPRGEPALEWLSLDIETTPDAGRVLSFAFVTSRGHEEVHMVSTEAIPGAVIHDDEATLLAAFAERIRDLDPDLLTGWNVVDFDLRVVCGRMDDLELSLEAKSLGRSPGRTDFPADAGFTRQGRAGIPGRMVLDGAALVRDALRLPDYRLETVARHVLDRGKKIDHARAAGNKAGEILRLYYEDPAAFVAYNLEDARLVPEILEHEGLLDLNRERSVLTGMQPDRVSASIACFDLVYLPELRRAGHVAPSVAQDPPTGSTRGGAVLDAVAGLARHVAVFDFKSLYPSVMRTFHLDPLALALGRDAPDEAVIDAPGGGRFLRETGPLPTIIERFMAGREAAKARGDAHASQAIKIMMNSMYGIFAAPACRFYSPDLANAITGFGQLVLGWTRDAMEHEGYPVLYGDTDSLFVQLDAEADPAKLGDEAEALRLRVADLLDRRISAEFGVSSKLDLELEKIFERFFLPHVRGGGSASKKRYAGRQVGRDAVEIAGLEAVRRDWPRIAGRLQEGLFERLFDDRSDQLVPFAREIVERLRDGSLDDELVYTKRIRKGTLDRYTASSPPHVQAARKIEERLGRFEGPVVHYVITSNGPEPLMPGEDAPSGVDHRHYLERVLRPVADAILEAFDASFDDVLGEPRQMRLI
jgi:DNA polymerase-2